MLALSLAFRFVNFISTCLLTFVFWCSALDLGMGLLPAFTLDMRRFGLAAASTVLALGNRATFLMDVRKWPIYVPESVSKESSDETRSVDHLPL